MRSWKSDRNEWEKKRLEWINNREGSYATYVRIWFSSAMEGQVNLCHSRAHTHFAEETQTNFINVWGVDSFRLLIYFPACLWKIAWYRSSIGKCKDIAHEIKLTSHSWFRPKAPEIPDPGQRTKTKRKSTAALTAMPLTKYISTA